MNATKQAIQKLETMGCLPASLLSMLKAAVKEDEQSQAEPLAYMAKVRKGSLAGQLIKIESVVQLNPEMYEGPFAVYRSADPAEVELLGAERRKMDRALVA